MNDVQRTAAPWLDATTPDLEQRIVRRALCDVGIVEILPGSNRSPRIDEYITAVGSPVGSPWCAAALAAWWRESGASVPGSDGGSCNAWTAWARKNALWRSTASIGRAVVYGMNGNAVHIGIVARMDPIMLSVEGNTTLADGFSSNGVAATIKQVDGGRVLGFIAPAAA